MKLDRCAQLFLLLCVWMLRSSAIETVNVVDFCGQTIRGDGMIVNSHHESKKYYFVTMGTDCHLTMQAISPKDKVQFYFRFFLVYSLLRVVPLSPAPLIPESPRVSGLLTRPKPTSGEGAFDPCHAGSYIQFYDGPDRSSPPLGPPLCGKSLPRPVLSTGNYLTLRLVTRGTQPRVDFVGDFTSFRLGFNQSDCSSEPYFSCRNGKCVPLSLVCDDKGIDNCGDGSDLEENLLTGCRAVQPLSSDPPPPFPAPSPALVNPSTAPPVHHNCALPDSSPSNESICNSNPWPVLLLYVALGVVVGGLLFCWCCWSPGWCLWRVSVCRFLPCCNSACQLCGGSKEQRVAKVSPHPSASGTATTATVSRNEECAPAAVV